MSASFGMMNTFSEQMLKAHLNPEFDGASRKEHGQEGKRDRGRGRGV